MGIFGNRNKPKKLNSKIISFEEAMKYVQSPEYANYEFIPVDENNLKKGFQVKPAEVVREHIDRIKTRKLNPSFEQTVIAGGIYKGIDSKVNQSPYNNYQNAKGYKKSRGFEIA